MNFVVCLLNQKLCKETPSFTNSFGTTVYPHLVPVKPAVFEKEQNSMAHFFAPSISYILFGSSFDFIKHSYAASNSITASFFSA